MYKACIKRLIDIVLAVLLLILTSWIFVLIIVLYWVTFRRPVFFRQMRIGRDETTFNLTKFRTLKGTDDWPQAERKFGLGSVLRFMSLDELPQLFHVLRGEMSLIGPRPLPVKYLSRFTPEQRKRHTIRPGITGWAQVNGRHSISWETKFAYDLEYVERCSLLFDLRIIARTILILLSFSKDVSLQEEEFQGKL